MTHCYMCGDDEALSYTKLDGNWLCSNCVADYEEMDNLDLEEYEERKRRRIQEQNEY